MKCKDGLTANRPLAKNKATNSSVLKRFDYRPMLTRNIS
jgi:hypothetical protein